MGDYITEVRLSQQLANLDAALERRDRLAAYFATSEINRLAASLKPRPKPSESRLVRNLPKWMRSIVRNRGVRVPALEEAFGASKVVITGRVGAQNMLELKIDF